MRLAALRLRQRDGITCGPTVAVVAGALLDADYGAQLRSSAWFAAEQGRIHATVNLVWPRRLGTTPMGMARALSAHRVRYRWRRNVRHDPKPTRTQFRARAPRDASEMPQTDATEVPCGLLQGGDRAAPLL